MAETQANVELGYVPFVNGVIEFLTAGLWKHFAVTEIQHSRYLAAERSFDISADRSECGIDEPWNGNKVEMQIKIVVRIARVVAQVLCCVGSERVVFCRCTALLLRGLYSWSIIFFDVDGVGFGFYRNVDRVANDLFHVNGVSNAAGVNCRNAEKQNDG